MSHIDFVIQPAIANFTDNPGGRLYQCLQGVQSWSNSDALTHEASELMEGLVGANSTFPITPRTVAAPNGTRHLVYQYRVDDTDDGHWGHNLFDITENFYGFLRDLGIARIYWDASNGQSGRIDATT